MGDEKLTPFSFVNEINEGKNDLILGSDNPELAEKSYVPFLVNRSLSNFQDTVLYANEMNVHCHIDKLLQFHFLLNCVRKKKRFSKWYKPAKAKDLESITEYYGCSIPKAIEILSLLTPEQMKTITLSLEKGGK